MKHPAPVCLTALLLAGCAVLSKNPHHTGPWNIAALQKPPAVEWGARTGLVQEVYYQGESYRSRPTRVFGYLARPADGEGPFPAMVLVHGGGGKAFRSWAEHWAKRGYVALAMDTAGCGPAGPLPQGGPDQSETTKFADFGEAEVRDMWTYHAVAAVIRGHSLLAALPEVDRDRIGITGISWGGYLACIVAGLDHRLKVAVPVYGCGFLGEDSVWKAGALAKMQPDARERWLRNFDPSHYLSSVDCPILFYDGSNDFAYPLDSVRASCQLVPRRLRHLSVIPDLKHGHIWTFGEVDCFVDSILRGGEPLPRLSPMRTKGGSVTAKVLSSVPLRSAALHWTSDSGDWQKRRWESLPAEIGGGALTARLPPRRPLVYYLSVTDGRGFQASTEYEELTVQGQP